MIRKSCIVNRVSLFDLRFTIYDQRSTVNGHRFSIYRFSFPVFKIPENEGAEMIQ